MILWGPLLGWPALAGLGVAAFGVTIFAVWVRARGAWWRAAAFMCLAGILAGPQYVRQTTRPLPDVALVVVDRSASMALGARRAQADAALAMLRGQAAGIAGLSLRVVDVAPADDGGTAMFAAVTEALAGVPAAQLAGVVAVTDGEVSDAPKRLAFSAPMTALLVAKGEETDRELRLVAASAYGLVGSDVSLRLQVLDHGRDDAGTAVPMVVTEDGSTVWQGDAVVGQVLSVDVPVRHAGEAVVAAAVASLGGEVSLLNDQVAFTLNGVARRLEVLLISGHPDQGERSWRLLLKSDPAVELVHFTILRTPDETMDAPPEDVALVPFPVAQLFDADLPKFDLIVLDQFDAAGLLPSQYLANIAAYVNHGGALLAQIGPEFATGDSLALTPLNAVLPAGPAPPGTLVREFAPSVTSVGARHPVTAPFAGQALAAWERMEAVTPNAGDVLMTGADHWPLLVLANEGQGRVGMLMSDQFWLWTRGGAHEGPALPLLRRVVHWLLREPALEAEALTARIDGGEILLRRQSLTAGYPGDAVITAPDGGTRTVTLRVISPGIYGAAVPAGAPGVWRVVEGGMTTFAVAEAGNAQEYQDLAASAGPLRGLAHGIWLGQGGGFDLKTMLMPRRAVEVTGTRDVPLLPPLPAMLMVIGLLVAAWWRERG